MSSQRSRRSPRKSQSQRSQSSQRTQQDSDSGFVDPALQTGRTMKKVCKENFLEAWKYCQTDDERQALRVQTEVVMLKLVRSELMLTDPMLILEDMGLNEPAEDDTSAIDAELDSFEKAVDDRREKFIKGLTPSKMKKHQDYVQMLNIINKKCEELEPHATTSTGCGAVEGDDTLEILEDDDGNVKELIPIKDPISKKTLVDPVRNSKCLHVYGKAQITSLLLKNRQIRCPQMGCPNRAFIRIQDLVDDPELKEKVRLKVAEVQRREAEVEKTRKEKGNSTNDME